MLHVRVVRWRGGGYIYLTFLQNTRRVSIEVTCRMILGHQYYSSRAPVLSFRENKDWGHSFLGTEALFAFFPAFPCLYLGIETLFAFFVRPGHFAVGRKSGKAALPTDRVCMRTSLICPQIPILSKRQGRGTSSPLHCLRISDCVLDV